MRHALAYKNGLSLIDLEQNRKCEGKLECLVSQTRWSAFGRFSLRRRCVLVMEVGPTSTQVASRRGKARTMANLGASSGEDG
jgi:hypothetical protein